jgi:hypothetical protein
MYSLMGGDRMDIDFHKLRMDAFAATLNQEQSMAEFDAMYKQYMEQGQDHNEALVSASTYMTTLTLANALEKMFEIYHAELMKKLQK